MLVTHFWVKQKLNQSFFVFSQECCSYRIWQRTGQRVDSRTWSFLFKFIVKSNTNSTDRSLSGLLYFVSLKSCQIRRAEAAEKKKKNKRQRILFLCTYFWLETFIIISSSSCVLEKFYIQWKIVRRRDRERESIIFFLVFFVVELERKCFQIFKSLFRIYPYFAVLQIVMILQLEITSLIGKTNLCYKLLL